jgi:putative DNA methylase
MINAVRGTRVSDTRLIEAGFPCHQVGAETQRERGASSALPPLYFLHVWWARRPLTPSRAAILGSLLPADTDPDWFLRELGIEKVQAMVGDVPWTLGNRLIGRIVLTDTGDEILPVDAVVGRAFQNEQIRRTRNLQMIREIKAADPTKAQDLILSRWAAENRPFRVVDVAAREYLPIVRVAGDPDWAQQRIAWESEHGLRTPDDKYGYSRAFGQAKSCTLPRTERKVVLDCTAGGGSIPFEALRLGHNVIANDLNPVAAVILHATLDYPARFGAELADDIECWGSLLRCEMVREIGGLFVPSQLVGDERTALEQHLCNTPRLIGEFCAEELDGYLYTRQVTCPHCGGEAPLLNTCWLSKSGDKWGVRIVTDGKPRGGKVSFQTYRIKGSRGPTGENPDMATVASAVGTCIHCRQAISADEIKAQARGESPHGTWQDRLYCVVAERYQPKLDKNGQPERYKSGERKGEIKTEKISFFRPPNETDLEALEEAEKRLKARWPEWERQGLIPVEKIPEGHKTVEPLRVGMTRWCDMFTPRQLLGHVTLIEELNRLKPEIMKKHGEERGRAIVTYLQFAIDKGVDYNSRQTRWHYSRGVLVNTFGRHDFSVKWTFGEMIFTGPNSGAAWGLSQVVDAYRGIASLVERVHDSSGGEAPPVNIRCGTAAHTGLADKSVDLVCFDPPYYNNVQYAELSDYFYVWQRRTLSDLYPDVFQRRLTNKGEEAVANPVRDGSTRKATERYEQMMGEIFAECERVLKDHGVMTVMFTHRTQEAWEALTRSLIESGWSITSTMPVESEAASSIHQMNRAAAASSIFITCRKRDAANDMPATWTGFGGTGVAQRVREAVRQGLNDFSALNLNPVDEMIAGYGRALHVLSENWPVYDGDDPVSPVRAMSEASAVVAQYQIERLTQGRLHVADLSSEAAMSLTLFGIFGLSDIPYDEVLNLSRSLGISLEDRSGGYEAKEARIGINAAVRGRQRAGDGEVGYHAPLIRQGAKIRLSLPEQRHASRLDAPQSEWDVLHGVIRGYRRGDIPVARAYLNEHAAGREQVIIDLLAVWAAEITDERLCKEANALLFGLK